MNKKLLLSISGLMLSITTITFSNNNPRYKIKNNSAWNIKYRMLGDKKEAELYPDQDINVAGTVQMEIRRSGMGSSYITSWYIVPKPYDVARKTLDIHKFHEFDLAVSMQNKKPVILIGTGWTGEWSFTVDTLK